MRATCGRGLREGGLCVACCWDLMIVLVAVGTMNLWAMGALAVVTALEKLWRHSAGFAKAIGVAFIAYGFLALAHPALLPGLAPIAARDMQGMSGRVAQPALRLVCRIARIAGAR